MACDHDVLACTQAVFYFVIFVLGFVVAIPLAVTVAKFRNNECILYTEFAWQNATVFVPKFSSSSVCNFPVYLAVFACIIYGLGMGCFTVYTVLRARNRDLSSLRRITDLQSLLTNATIAFLMLVACCMISVGINSTCDSFLDNPYAKQASCSLLAEVKWNLGPNQYTNPHCYSYPQTSEISAWVTFLVWLIQLALSILRCRRSQRQGRRHTSMGSNVPATVVMEPSTLPTPQ